MSDQSELLATIERQVYRGAYGDGYVDGWRAGAAFQVRSDELTEATRRAVLANVAAFREDHEKRRKALSGGGAR